MIAARSNPISVSNTGLRASRWSEFDGYMLFTTVVLMAFGVIAIWSADGGGPLTTTNLGVRQAGLGLIGVGLMFLVARFDYRFFRTFAWLFYAVGVVALLLVLTRLGVQVGGSQNWFEVGGLLVQPSEFAKIGTLIALAAFVSSRGAAMREIGNVIVSMLIVGLPMVLIVLEPDLGSTLVYGVMWLSVMMVAQTRRLFFGLLLLLAGPLIFIAWEFVLFPYQQERLLVFLDPYADQLGGGYNIIQAWISIGAGGWLGFGLTGGTQSQFNLLGVRETDFIFAHASGMFGFIGMIALFAAMIIFLWRCLRVAETARDTFGQCLAVGITSIVFFQAVVNIGMNIGLMPVTGLTLPFVSYGVSSLWTFLIAQGILQSIRMRHRKLAFQT